jgi:23S rRNA pseudouridine1911/1915/1917 synthase
VDVLSATTAQGRIVHCRIKEKGTLLDCLATFGVSRDEGEHLLSFGAIYHERERVSSDRVLSPGHYVRVHLQPKRFPVEAIDWASTVVYENDQFVVANKPAGIPVHATVDNKLENVLHQLSLTLQSTLHITQRLDAEVGGLIVFAKTREFQRQFNRLLVERKVRKKYRALVTCAPELGRHVHYLKPERRSPKTIQREAHPDWLECVLRVDNVTPIGDAANPLFEVEIDLETGRTHQIRAQLWAIGSPIVGDNLYGATSRHEVDGVVRPGIALVSLSTAWCDEEGQEWSFGVGFFG